MLIGWNEVCSRVSGARLTAYFMDRLLGLNDVEPQTPTQTPYTVDQLFTDLAADGRLDYSDATEHRVLTFFRGASGESATAGEPVCGPTRILPVP